MGCVRRWTDVRKHSSKSVGAGRRGEEHSNSHSSTPTLGDRRQLLGTVLVLWLSARALLDGAPPPAVRAAALRRRRVITFTNRSALSVWARVAWHLEAWEGGDAGKHLGRVNRPPLVPRIFNCAGGRRESHAWLGFAESRGWLEPDSGSKPRYIEFSGGIAAVKPRYRGTISELFP